MFHFREANGFLCAQAKKAMRGQAVIKKRQYFLLQSGLKINKNIAAAYQVKLVKHTVGYQVVN